MKKYIGALFLLITTSLFTTSCNKNKDASYLRGQLDGEHFECSSTVRANQPERIPGLGDDPTLRITAEWPSYSLKLVLITGGSIGKGTYPFELGKDRSAQMWQNSTDSYYAGNSCIICPSQLYGSGSITINEITKKYVKGTFEFTAVNSFSSITKTVTNGEFSVGRE